MDKDRILELCRMDRNGRVFALGMFDTKVTIYAQQLRGYNLAWALIEAGLVATGSRVAIVGGGAAGLSAAVGLTSAADASITLFEAATHLMPLQHNNRNRFIQPNIYDWPDRQETSTTALPDLQWHSGLAGDVQKQILSRFRDYRGRIEIRCGTRVRRWRSRADGVELGFRGSKAGAEPESGRYDLLVLALGFGVERSLDGRPTLSYWNNDMMDQVGPGRYLVHGVGDGGLTDAMRLAILDLPHREILFRFQHNQSAILLGKSLRAGENALRGEFAAGGIGEAEHLERHHRLYAETLPLASHCDYLASHLRPDTIVSLCSRGHMYAPNASILNKLIIRHLEAIDAVRWCPQAAVEKERAIARSFYRVGAKRQAPDLARRRPAGFDPLVGREIGSSAAFPHEYFRLRHEVTAPRILVILSRVQDPARSGDLHASPNSQTQQCVREIFDDWAVRERGQRAQWIVRGFDPRPAHRPEILDAIGRLQGEFDLVLAHGSDIGVALFHDGSPPRLDEVIESAGGKPVIFFGARSGLRVEDLAPRPIYLAEQMIDLERLRNLLQIGFPNEDLYYVSSDRYPVDTFFYHRFAAICSAAAAVDPTHFRFHLFPVSEEDFAVDQLPENRLYVGRFLAHYLGHKHGVMRERSFLSSYEVDIAIGAIATMDSSAEECARLIVEQILVPLLQSELPRDPMIPVANARITVSRRNAARRGMALREAFLGKARVVW